MTAPIEPGAVLAGKFRVDQVLGQGGMGVVVAAHHLHLDEQVAIKFLLPHALTDAKVVARFAQEARAAVKIKSEHVARVIDVGTLDNGAPYIVMERLIGSDLGDLVLKHGKLPVEDAVDYVLQASEAVAEAHALGIVHRDLKPANLFLTHRADGSPCVKVLDFGISKMMPQPGVALEAGLTHSSVVMGSPNYMSPEQLASTRDVDTRTDVYALGGILFHFIAGRPPYVAESFAELCSLVLNGHPDPLRALVPGVPAELEKAILAALEKHPGKRLQTVAALAQRIVPFGPARARLSAERISRVLKSTGAVTGGAVVASTAPEHGPDGATMNGLGQTVSGKRHSALWAIALAATLLAAGAIAVTQLRGSGDDAPGGAEAVGRAASPSAPALQSAVPATAHEAPPAATTPGEPIVTPLPAAPPAPPEAPGVPTVTPLPSPARPAASKQPDAVLPASSARPAPAKPKVNCEPAYYFDKDGHKHFKPECF